MRILVLIIIFLSLQKVTTTGAFGLYPNQLDLITNRRGFYKIQPTRPSRMFNDSTCFLEPQQFLTEFGMSKEEVAYSAETITGLWVDAEMRNMNITFHGAEKTVSVFQEGMSLNILIDKDLSIQRFLLRNGESNATRFSYDTEEGIMDKFKLDGWSEMDIVHCEHLLFVLSRTYGAYKTSVTIIDGYKTHNAQHFLKISGGIGGFYRTF